jgi:hypothetical protein
MTPIHFNHYALSIRTATSSCAPVAALLDALFSCTNEISKDMQTIRDVVRGGTDWLRVSITTTTCMIRSQPTFLM